jgi:hypothetical protein
MTKGGLTLQLLRQGVAFRLSQRRDAAMPDRTPLKRMQDRALPAVCRPAGWIAVWRRIGTLSVLDRKGPALF